MSGRLPVQGEDFTYTGNCQVIEDSVANGQSNWRIKFLTSGVLTFASDVVVDAFYVGGGGGAANLLHSVHKVTPGGGGGYTRTVSNIEVTKETSYQIVIGNGNAVNTVQSTSPKYAGSSSGFGNSVSGGVSAYTLHDSTFSGGNGGSGGGSVISFLASASKQFGNGGSDGGNGEGGYSYSSVSCPAGTGQGTTTREFGEVGATVYAGGGGCGGYYHYNDRDGRQQYKPGSGGSGGGGRGGCSASYPTETSVKNNTAYYLSGSSGTANTGGGGGGGGKYTSPQLNVYYGNGADGGSGIVVIRNHRT